MIKLIKEAEFDIAYNVVKEVFDNFVAKDYSVQGVANYYKFIESLKPCITTGEVEIYGYFVDNECVAVLAVKNKSHICLFYVNQNHHGKGIAKSLFAKVLEKTDEDITVNASDFGIKVYEKFGFRAVDKVQKTNGMHFTPMKLVRKGI